MVLYFHIRHAFFGFEEFRSIATEKTVGKQVEFLAEDIVIGTFLVFQVCMGLRKYLRVSMFILVITSTLHVLQLLSFIYVQSLWEIGQL